MFSFIVHKIIDIVTGSNAYRNSSSIIRSLSMCVCVGIQQSDSHTDQTRPIWCQ